MHETNKKRAAFANIQCINSLHKAGIHTRLAAGLKKSISSLCYIQKQAKTKSQVGMVLLRVKAI
jgi:hypothetical protein